MLNTAEEMYYSASALDKGFCRELLSDISNCCADIRTNFTDDSGVIHEVIRKRDGFFKELLGEHANPGHTLEDMWFIADAADILGDEALYSYAARTATRALEMGWDEPYGGLLHYSTTTADHRRLQRLDRRKRWKASYRWLGDKLWWCMPKRSIQRCVSRC